MQIFPLITIQILNWNRAIETLSAIASAKAQTYENFEIIVIDNGSTDNSVQLISEAYPDITLVELGKNFGCPGGRNLGVPHCNGDYIFYLDNDGSLHKDAVKNAYDTISSESNIAIVAGVIYDYMHPSEIDNSCIIKSNAKRYTREFKGGVCLHDKSIYSKTGMYPSHFIYGSEEYYLALRVFNSGMNIVVNESVVLWHVRSNTARSRSKELTNSFFNRLYVAVSSYPSLEAAKFVLYFIPTYIYYAKRDGFLMYFLTGYVKNFIKTLSGALRYRQPISKSTYIKFKNFRETPFLES